MEEQNKEVIQEQEPKQEHTRITLSSFLYVLVVIAILSLVCLCYAVYLRKDNNTNKSANANYSLQTIQTSQIGSYK